MFGQDKDMQSASYNCWRYRKSFGRIEVESRIANLLNFKRTKNIQAHLASSSSLIFSINRRVFSDFPAAAQAGELFAILSSNS